MPGTGSLRKVKGLEDFGGVGSYRGDPKVSRWIFGPRDDRGDRGVASCPFNFRGSAPDPSRDRKEIPSYSSHAIEKEEKPA